MAKGKVYRSNVHKPDRWEDWKDQLDAIHYVEGQEEEKEDNQFYYYGAT
jgi:hypothetical protein